MSTIFNNGTTTPVVGALAPTPTGGGRGGTVYQNGNPGNPSPGLAISGATNKLQLTDGWWVFIGCLGGFILSGTVLAPFALGILGIALIYQTSQLVEGK